MAASACLLAQTLPPEQARSATREDQLLAFKIARAAIHREAGRNVSLPAIPAGSILNRPAPVFITIIHNDRRTGCVGSFQPQSRTLAEDIASTAVKAWRQDTRTRPLTLNQLESARFVIAIPGQRRQVTSTLGYPPDRYGIQLTSGRRTSVILPEEARTSSWALREARRLAGISPEAPVQLQVFQATLWREPARAPEPAKRPAEKSSTDH